MKTLLLLLILLLGSLASSVGAVDVIITTNGTPSYVTTVSTGNQIIAKTTSGRLYSLLDVEAANDSLQLFTSTDNGASWYVIGTAGTNLFLGPTTYENNPIMQVIDDTVYIQSTTSSTGFRTISKVYGDSVYTYNGSTRYFDSLSIDDNWADPRNAINFRNDSLITFKDTTGGLVPVIGQGGRLANDGTTAWTQGTAEPADVLRYNSIAINGVVASFGWATHDVFVHTGYDMDTAATNFPPYTPEGYLNSGWDLSLVSAGPLDSIGFGAFEFGDSCLAFRFKVTYNGTNWVLTVIDSTTVVPRGFVPITDGEQNSIFPSITLRNDSAYIAYQKMADTTVTTTKTVYYKVYPIRGAAGTFVGGAEQTLRASTGADTLWYFSLPPASPGDYLTGQFQATNNAVPTTWKSVTISFAQAVSALPLFIHSPEGNNMYHSPLGVGVIYRP